MRKISKSHQRYKSVRDKALFTVSGLAIAGVILPTQAYAASAFSHLASDKISSIAIAVNNSLANNPKVGENEDFTSFSFEDLMSVEVTSVSKRVENVNDAAAAIFVLTDQDIKRSGAVTIPDALRLVPGVNVAQINANSWAVTVRGFNSRFANKLLVMIDGRSVYTPLFSGVNWDRQNIILEDIDRIEVIRGPGATLWGANAVNGVINIITKTSDDTQGTLLKASAGDQFESQLVARHGGNIGENGKYRIHTKYESFNGGNDVNGNDVGDDWQNVTAGFRTDFNFSNRDNLTISGDVNLVTTGRTTQIPVLTAPFVTLESERNDSTGANLNVKWTRALSDTSELTVQGYIDYADIEIPQGTEERLTFDISAQHSLSLGEKHNLIYGVGYRNVSDELGTSSFVTFDRLSRTAGLYSGFIQDTIQVSETFDLTLGSKFEHNDYTGFEVQPSIRAKWQPTAGYTYWGAISRAVRTPSRVEDNIRAIAQVIPANTPGLNPAPFPAVVQLTGDEAIESEELLAYELGARFQIGDNILFDTTVFYNEYENLRGSRIGAPVVDTVSVPPRVIVPLTVEELLETETYGIEAVLDWQAAENLRFQATVSKIDFESTPVEISPAVSVTNSGGSDPGKTATLRSFWDISKNLTVDTAVRYVDEVDSFNIDAYTAVDARAAYQFDNDLEVAVTGRNLTDDAQIEFGVDPSFATVPSKVERSVYISLTKKF